jgi:hypothetical protein
LGALAEASNRRQSIFRRKRAELFGIEYSSGVGTITRASAPVARMAANAVAYSFGLSTQIEEELKISRSTPSAQLNP